MASKYRTSYQAPLHRSGGVARQPYQQRYENMSTAAVTVAKPSPFKTPGQPARLIAAAPAPVTPTSMSVEVMPLLPQPTQILKSQESGTQCMVCSRFGCTLVSHKHFAELLKNAKTAAQTQTQSSGGITQQLKSTSLSLVPPPRSPSQPAVQYPVLMNAERKDLLEKWSHPFGMEERGPERHLFPFKFIDIVLPAAMSHAPLFQSLLALAASLSSAAQGHIDDISHRHQNLAVQLLSQTCPDEVSASKDECILSALLVMLTFMIQADMTEAGRHMSGINHLVMIRGGPHYLGISGVVAETLLYADYMHAIFFDQPLVWNMPIPALDVGPPTSLGKGFERMADGSDLNAELVQAARSLCKLTELFKLTSIKPSEQNIVHATGYLASISEYQLTRCNTTYHDSMSRIECVGLALLLFNHAVLRDYGITTPFVRKIEYQLWNCLLASEESGVWANTRLELLMWVIFTGIITELRGQCRWMLQAVDRLRRLQQQLRFKDWTDVKTRVLDEFCWLSEAQETTLQAIWVREVVAHS